MYACVFRVSTGPIILGAQNLSKRNFSHEKIVARTGLDKTFLEVLRRLASSHSARKGNSCAARIIVDCTQFERAQSTPK